MPPLLEIIALDADDARAAERGGADRIELVSAIHTGGLSPRPETFSLVRDAVRLPVRVMIRHRPDFAAGDLPALLRAAKALRAAGAEEFVLGFLDERGAVDRPAVEAVLEVLDGCPWTFHRAIDSAADRAAAWSAIEQLPGVSEVLTAGAPTGITDGLTRLLMETRPGLLAGGGLREEHVPQLLAAGVDAFHSGTAVRGGRWDVPVDAALVRRWRTVLSASGTDVSTRC
jgi:copper homeostasis protein